MIHRIRAATRAAAGFAAVWTFIGSAELAAQDHTATTDVLTIEEWTVPYPDSRPRDPFVGPDGRVWFVGQAAHYAAVLDPATGEFTRYDMDDGTGPHNLIVDDDGLVYYAGNRANHIGIIDPATGEIDKIMMPDERARDPHTLIWDDNGDIWFSVQGGNLVGFLDKETRDVRLVEAPEVETRRGMGSSRPYGVKLDSENRPWIAHFNTNLIGMVEPSSFELIGYDLPEGARPRRLVIDSNDRIWYVDYSRGRSASSRRAADSSGNTTCRRGRNRGRTGWRSTSTMWYGSSRRGSSRTGSWASTRTRRSSWACSTCRAAAARSGTCTTIRPRTRSGSGRT